jgi:hypothetical protein
VPPTPERGIADPEGSEDLARVDGAALPCSRYAMAGLSFKEPSRVPSDRRTFTSAW